MKKNFLKVTLFVLVFLGAGFIVGYFLVNKLLEMM
jgi:uncharacterized protein YneF (UPF0154 family)